MIVRMIRVDLVRVNVATAASGGLEVFTHDGSMLWWGYSEWSKEENPSRADKFRSELYGSCSLTA